MIAALVASLVLVLKGRVTNSDMSASATWRRGNGHSALVKSFGRRRRTKFSEERTRGPQTMVYGYFCFRLSLATSRPAVGSAGGDAICPNRRCIGWRCRWGSPARGGFEASLTTDGANSTVGRNGGVAAGNCGRPCRVTANFSRLVEC